ncbi:MAG: sulfatase [Flavobacteriaceae bacterium]|nr:sulfatase [Flavobacteriaceae bacterium]MCY4217526.1 sulfatase [Flavobacteriaceae bacterium]MCY4254127.1 sulfatase [Flavobacteriaceae bacterium]
MNLSLISKVFLFGICFTLISSSEKSGQSLSKPPNMVFFFVDDMGWQDTSLPFHTEITRLNKQYHTPNMERLARQGMKFTQAYASAVCSPSRISLMTGVNAAKHGVTNWTLFKNKSTETDHPTLIGPNWNLNGLSPDPDIPKTFYAKTLPEYLKSAGYATIHVGKAHFGAKDTPGENPLNLGFDVNIAGHAAGGPGSYLAKNNFSAQWRNGMQVWDVPDLDKYYGSDIYLTEALTIEANLAVHRAIQRNKPFYLYMSHYAVHSPWEIDQRFYQKYIDRGLNEFDATFASMLEGMDKSLGDIMDNLKALGVEKNTIIIFMSDNGSPRQTARNLPLRGFKLTPYEGGTRVPMIVKWPHITQENSQTNQPIIIEDIFPTVLEMAGLRQNIPSTIDGISFVPILKENKATNNNRSFIWHFPNLYDTFPYSSIRKGPWKLIYHHTDQKFELFNLAEDLSESKNLINSNPTKARELALMLSDYLESADAVMPIDKTTHQAVPFPKFETID